MISVPRKVRNNSPFKPNPLITGAMTAGLLAALLVLVLPVRAGSDETASCAIQQKVLPPIEVFLEPLDENIPGQVARFRVVVIPRVVPREVRITCRPAPEIEWVSGDSVTVRSGALDRRDELNLAVRVPTSGFHPLHVMIELTAEDGTVWRRGVGTRLGPDDVSKTARSVSPADGGRRFIEYPAAAAVPGVER
jgi:hypothetical protein